ncbi:MULTISPECIES: hypothetical protein [Citrobacter]|uniref:hypothetical protein n=1 Tax=Citrobacter TaxID=544 RepID=UPI0006DB5C81|nr:MULTISPECIES: hypothetical protein [Citrobacter]OCO57269.1 hypothetical protein AN688_0226060 [Citrobacter freundii]KAA1148838.1 hypothetical protein D3H39_04590 [Citrobacter portucalensis]MDM2854047.1 hypothetical protein [Citrobacter sp. Cpo065]MDQ9158426.1 hypothetical protein [Citrobacter portucalensis]MDT7469063.1 hypothetical protein [Citrobacter portucalensis]
MTVSIPQPNTEPPLVLDFNWNTLFRGDRNNASFNACVGHNGSPDIYYYADGFAESVFILIKNIIDDKGTLDTLIYPICFSLRHSVELTLKGLIEDLADLAKLRKRTLSEKISDVLTKHDIGNLWSYLENNATNIDRRFRQPLKQLAPRIKCIADTDPTGQTFRYSYDTNSVKHLTDVSIINVLVLREQFEILRDQLEALTSLVEYLREEYRTGTFTQNLNREDILAIAQKLPARETWSKPEVGLSAIKTSIKAEYNIGSKELSEAFNFIQSTRDMARLIGLPTSVPGLSKVDFIKLNSIWKTAWSLEVLEDSLRDNIYRKTSSDKSCIPVNMMQELDLLESARKKPSKSKKIFLQWATPENMAGLSVLLDSRISYFSEDHDRIFGNRLKLMKSTKSSGQDTWETEIDDLWRRSVAKPFYPEIIVERLKGQSFTEEASVVTTDLFHRSGYIKIIITIKSILAKLASRIKTIFGGIKSS